MANAVGRLNNTQTYMLQGTGAPSGITGFLNDQYFDVTNAHLYINTDGFGTWTLVII